MDTMKKWNNVISVIAALIGVGIISLSNKFPIKSGGDPGAGFWPSIIGAILVICAVGLFILNIVHKEKEEKKSVSLNTPANKCVYLMMGIIVIFCIGLYVLGFYISALIFIPAVMHLLGDRNKRNMIMTSVVTVGAVYIIFGLLLKTQLPGPIFLK